MNKETMQLIDAALEASITPSDFAALQETLRQDPAALEYYCQQAEIHGRLEWELKVSGSDAQPQNVVPFRRSKSLRIAAVAAVVAIAGVSIYSVVPKSGSGTTIASNDKITELPSIDLKEDFQHNIDATLARITNTQDAQWQGDSLEVGSWLKPGTIHLHSGKAEITFISGARVVLHGPAELDSVTPHLAYLKQGKGVVHIPQQAEGFQLETPSSSFTDQECSFALAVENDITEIHVIKGSIEASPSNSNAVTTTLNANDSLRLNSTSTFAQNTQLYAVNSFQSELPVASNQQEAEYLRWSFDSIESDAFPETGNHEQSHFPAKIEQLARIPGEAQAQSIKGKFGRAARFNGKGSYLSTNFQGIPGATERTIACWVRVPVDAKNSQAYAIFSWGEPQSQTGSKWQVALNTSAYNNGIIGALRTEFGGGYVIGSTNLRDGRWHHITSVYLGGHSSDVTSQVLHYVDGRLESVSASKQQAISSSISAKHSHFAYIGRRLENDPEFSSFKGDIDELHVFPAALTPAQVESLYLFNSTPRTLIQRVAKK